MSMFFKNLHIGNVSKNNFHQNRSMRSTPTEMSVECFSHNEKILLRNTWDKLAEDKEILGIAICICIFEKMPVVSIQDLKGEELMSNALFDSNAKRFIHAVGTTCLDECPYVSEEYGNYRG